MLAHDPNKYKKKREKRLRWEAEARILHRKAPQPFSKTSAAVGKMIAAFRESRGLTQAKLSEAVGTTQSVIARIEKGRHNLTLKKFEMIAKALKKELKINLA